MTRKWPIVVVHNAQMIIASTEIIDKTLCSMFTMQLNDKVLWTNENENFNKKKLW